MKKIEEKIELIEWTSSPLDFDSLDYTNEEKEIKKKDYLRQENRDKRSLD